MAIEMLSLWEEAAHDLHVASKLHFDEIGQMLKKFILCYSMLLERHPDFREVITVHSGSELKNILNSMLLQRHPDFQQKKKKMDAKKIEEMKDFVEHRKQSPSDQSLDGRIPAFGESYKDGENEDKPTVSMHDSSNVESDVEFDNSYVVEPDNDPPHKSKDAEISMDDKSDVLEPDNDPPQKMGDSSADVTKENQEAAELSNAKAKEAIAYGKFDEATRDFHAASKSELDYDEEMEQMLKKVETNANNELEKTEFERKRRRDAEAASVLKDGEVITVHSGSELENILNVASEAFRLSVIYFTATWCGPCRYAGPIFKSLAAKYPTAVFLKVDIDEARDVAAEWRPSHVPYFFFVRNGVEVDKFTAVYKSEIENKFAQHCG